MISWLNIVMLLTHFFYWWKDLSFCCSENYSLFWLFIQISCVSRSSTTLCLSYCSFGSSCKITAVVGLFERLLLRTAVHSLTTTPIFFFLDPFWCTFITSMFFCRIVYMRHNLNEDQIVGRSVIKTGMLNSKIMVRSLLLISMLQVQLNFKRPKS